MVRSVVAAALLVAALPWVAPHAAPASSALEPLLEQADTIRSSDPRRFQSLLAQLEARRAQASVEQRQRLDYLQAYSLAYRGKADAAIRKARVLFEQSSAVDIKFRAGSLVVNGHAINRDFGEGLRYVEQTLAMRDRVRDPEIRHDGINSAAILYNQLGQYALGRSYASETLADSPAPRARCFADHVRLEALYHLGQLPRSDASLRSAVDQCIGAGELIVANFIRITLARRWAALGERDAAIELLRSNLQDAQATRYPRMIAEMQSLLAELLLARGDLSGATTHARTAVSLHAGDASSLPLVTAYRVLYDVANRQGDAGAALAAYRSYSEADKAYVNDVKARELAYQMVRQETAQKSQQIELLDRENRVLQLQRRVDRQAAQNTQLVVALLVLLLASIGYWAYKTKRVQMSLRRLAESDVLTGLCNRHHFTQQAEAALAQAKRSGEPVALVMFDLDHFKSINDTYGHVTGDWVLRQVSQTCSGFCRSIDCIGRWGGEEFAILLTGCQLQDAVRLADDCRVRLSQIDTRDSGHTFPVSASFGVASSLYSGHELSRLLSHSDQALYRAKRAGRDRVEAYLPDEPRHLVDNDRDRDGDRNDDRDPSGAGASPAQG